MNTVIARTVDPGGYVSASALPPLFPTLPQPELEMFWTCDLLWFNEHRPKRGGVGQ